MERAPGRPVLRSPGSTRALPGARAFTLVELMIVVAIIGVLAALAIYGVRRYLAASKTSEAKQTVGAIQRDAVAAFERETAPSEDINEGNVSSTMQHKLCATAIAVPNAVPKGTKYQPSTQDGKDFHSGDFQTGWWCLRFRVDQPIYYQYVYTKDSSAAAPNNPAKCANNCYEAAALGDLNGNNVVSRFAMTGQITPSQELKNATQLYIENETE